MLYLALAILAALALVYLILRLLRECGCAFLVLTIPNQKGEWKMGAPVTLTLGAGAVQATEQEFLNGQPEPNNGPIQYSSDTPAVATVDPATGIVTPVAAGVANITATDSVSGLTDSVAVTVVAPVNTSMTLTIPTN